MKRRRKVYNRVNLLETSVVGIPAYPEATLSYEYIEQKEAKQMEETPATEIKSEPAAKVEVKETLPVETKETLPVEKEVPIEKIEKSLTKDEVIALIKEEMQKAEVPKQGLVEKDEKAEVKAPALKYEKGHEREFFDKVGEHMIKSGFFQL